MNTPILLSGAVLLFWGWQTGFLWIALFCAVILEAARLVSWRWDFSSSEIRRAVYLSTALGAGGLIYYLAAGGEGNITDAFMRYFRFLPAALVPLAAVQAYGTMESIEIGDLMILNRSSKGKKEDSPASVNLSYPYLAVCLLSAGASNNPQIWFYAVGTVLILWGLLASRPRSFPIYLWLGLAVCVWGLGFIGHIGLHRLQGKVENAITSYYERTALGDDVDPYRSRTSIGSVADRQLSDRIVFRIDTGGEPKSPFLLREAVYNGYAGNSWFARPGKEEMLSPGTDGSTWKIGEAREPVSSMRISGSIGQGMGVLPMPFGAFQVEDLAASEIRRTDLGTIKVGNAPRMADFTVRTSPAAFPTEIPNEGDLRMAKKESDTFGPLAEELDLKNRTQKEAVRKVKSYFGNNFSYSLSQKADDSNTLEGFMLKTRSGHCEYFATSTVLLLRAAGIPARYATGYLVNEYSQWEGAYVVRGKHSHAWAMAYVDGAWQELDTTPPVWFDAANQSAGVWTGISDIWSWMTFKAGRLMSGVRPGRYAAPAVILLAVVIIWRLFGKKRILWGRKRRPVHSSMPRRQGKDSEFYEIELILSGFGLSRGASESVTEWINRAREDERVRPYGERLAEIVTLHCKYRFDPDGLSLPERENLRSMARHLSADLNQHHLRRRDRIHQDRFTLDHGRGSIV